MDSKKIIFLCTLGIVLISNPLPAQNAEWQEISALISKYYGEWTDFSYPGLGGNNRIPNTALLGNGDIGVVSGGNEESKTFYISKGDFWTYNGSPVPIGGITIGAVKNDDPDLSDGSDIVPPIPGKNSMYEKQDILNAQIISSYKTAALTADICAIAAATNNYILIHITSTADKDQELAATLWAKADNASYPVTSSALSSTDNQCVIVTRTTPNVSPANSVSYKSEAAMMAKLIGANGAARQRKNGKADLVFTLPAGQNMWIVVAVGGGGRTYDHNNNLITEMPTQQVRGLLSSVNTQTDVETLLKAHQNWWKNYWQTSYIQLDTNDAQMNTLMKYYYAAQYALACNIREGKVAPGLYGLWHVTDNPSWKSDFHLNYNFISTFYGVNTSNRVYQGLPAIEAILQYVEQGRKNASTVSELRKVRSDFVTAKIQKGDIDAQNGIPNAILYPVGIGPWGMTLDNGYHNEALNAAFSAYPMIEYYNYTLDTGFLENTLYNYLKLCVGFYEKWLEDADGKQVLYAGYNEGSWSINPAVELSVLKSALKNLIQASKILKKDAEKRPAWQHILDNLSPQPTAVYQDKTVYTLAEKEWVNNQWQAMSNPVPGDGNIIPMEAVIPGEQLGYFSPAEQLAVAKNTIDVFSGRGAWGQSNNFPKIFAVAVNTRYPVQTVIDNLTSTINQKMKANLLIEDNVHGIEKAGATEAINNMMITSDKGVIAVFPGWVKTQNAKFVRLREKGAFVVSAEYNAEKQEVAFIEVLSEAGQPFTLASPWAEGIRVKDADGKRIPVTKGTAPNHPDESIYTFNTQKGKTCRIEKSTGNYLP